MAIVAAWFVISDFSASDRAYIKNAAHESQNYADQTQQRIRDACGSVASIGHQDCVAKEDAAAREYERNEYDLAAQMTMAWWTKVMGAAAVLGVLLSAVGVYLIWQTFKETRNAAISAARNYEAFARFESAVLVAEFHETPSFFKEDGKMFIRMRIRCQNFGRTTAAVTAICLEGEEPIPYSFMSKPDKENVFNKSWKICVDGKTQIKGYIEYSSQVELSIRRRFHVGLKIKDSPGACKATMHTGGVLRPNNEKYDKPLE